MCSEIRSASCHGKMQNMASASARARDGLAEMSSGVQDLAVPDSSLSSITLDLSRKGITELPSLPDCKYLEVELS